MLNTQRFYIRPLAFFIINSLSFSPLTASFAVAAEKEMDSLNLLQGLDEGSSQAGSFIDDSNISVNPSDTGLNISIGGQSTSLSTADDMFKSDDKEARAMLDKAKNLGESDSLQGAIDYGQQLKSKYSSENDTSDAATIYQAHKKMIQDGRLDLSNDPVVTDALKVFDPEDPNSIYNYFSDACQETTRTSGKTRQTTKFVGTEETCMKYSTASANCNIRHSYDVKVIETTSEESPIYLEQCSCRKDDPTCTDESIKHCTSFWIGANTSRNNLLNPDNKNDSRSCIVYRQKVGLIIHKPQALTKLYLDGASIDDNAAVYLYKYGENPDYAKPIWKSHGVIPARNISYNKELNGSVHFCNPVTESNCAIPKYEDNRTYLPAYDVITGALLDDPKRGKLYSGETDGKYKAPLVDLTSFFTHADADDVYVIEFLLSVSGRGDGSLHLRAEYDPALALDEFWTAEDKCLDKLEYFSENSRLTTGAITCTAYGHQVKIGDMTCGITNGHVICPEAFGKQKISYLLTYDDKTAEYIKEPVFPNHLTCTNFNFSYSTLSPSENAINHSCQELLQTAKDSGRTCYMTKTECIQTSAEAEEERGGSSNNDDCYLKEITYNCGKEETIEETSEKVQTTCGSNNMVINCEGGSCVGITPTVENTGSFAKTSAILQAVDFMAQDFKCVTVDGEECTEDEQREHYIEIFSGKRKHCHIFDTGLTYQNCCKNMSGVTVNNYMHDILVMSRLLSSKQVLGKYVDKLDPTGLSTALNDKSLTAADKLNTKVNSWLDSITGVEGGANLAQNTVMLLYVNAYKAEIAEALSGLVKKIGENISGKIAQTAGAAGIDEAQDEASKKIAEQTSNQALESLSSAVSIVGTVYTVYSIVNMSLKLIFKCRNIDFETASDKALKKCYQVESKCKVKVLNPFGKSKTCADREFYFCCYNSPLARIVMQQIKKTGQLGLSEDNKSCVGIRLDQLEQLDWSKLDLSEWTSLILEAQNASLGDNELNIVEKLSEQSLAPSDTATALENNSTSDSIAELVMYFSDRDEDEALMKEFKVLPQDVREAIIAREQATQAAYEDSVKNSSLSEEEYRQYNELAESNIRDDNANIDESAVYSDTKNLQTDKELMAAQLNYSLIKIGKLSLTEIAEAVLDYRISVPGSLYDVILSGYDREKRKLNATAQKIVKQIKSDNTDVKISSVPLTVENISGEKSALNINRSSSTNPEACSDHDKSCVRKSATVRLDNTIKILQDIYGNAYRFSLEAEETTPKNPK